MANPGESPSGEEFIRGAPSFAPTPTTSVSDLVAGLDLLRQELAGLSADSKEATKAIEGARQKQAETIDIQKLLAAEWVRESTALEKLKAQIGTLKEYHDTLTSNSQEYRDTTDKIRELEQAQNYQVRIVSNLSKESMTLGSALMHLHGQIKSMGTAARTAAESVGYRSDILLKRPRAMGAALSSGLPATSDAVKYLASITGLGTELVKLGEGFGAVLLAIEAVQAGVKIFTRETTTYADVYAGRLGMATDAQAEFIAGAPGFATAFYNIADVQKVGSAAMKAGAFDSYTAQRGLQGNLSEMSAHMLAFGKAMGLTAEESGKQLALFATKMGAFGGMLKPTNATLGHTMDTLGMVANASKISMSGTISMLEEMSAVTMPAGIAFNTLSNQVGLSSQVLREYGDTLKGTDNAVLATSAGLKQMLMSLFSYGAGISPEQMAGYQLASGTPGKGNIAQRIMANIGMTPYQRIAAQMDMLKTAHMTPAWQGVAMLKMGLPQELAGQLYRMQTTQPKEFDKLMGAFRLSGTDKELQSRLHSMQAGAPKSVQETIDAVGQGLQLLRPPQEQMVDLLQNVVRQLAALVKIGQRGFIGAAFGTSTNTLMARPTAAPAGGGSAYTTSS